MEGYGSYCFLEQRLGAVEYYAILCLSLLGPTGCYGILPRWPPVAPVVSHWHTVCGADGVSLQVVLPALHAQLEDVGWWKCRGPKAIMCQTLVSEMKHDPR